MVLFQNELRKKGEVRLFKLGMQENQLAVVYTKDYKAYVESCCRSSQKVGKYIFVVIELNDTSVRTFAF